MTAVDIYPYFVNTLGIPPIANVQIGGKATEKRKDLDFGMAPEAFALVIILSLLDFYQKMGEIFSQIGENTRAQGKRASEEHHSHSMKRRQEEGIRREVEKHHLAQRIQTRYAQRQAIHIRTWQGNYNENRHLSLPV